MIFHVGDTVFYRDHAGKIDTGIVVIGGTSDNTVAVQFDCPSSPVAIHGSALWRERPDWAMDRECLCGCTFGDHGPSGCTRHGLHRFTPKPAAAQTFTVNRSELVPGGHGIRIGTSDEYPDRQFLIIPITPETHTPTTR